MQLVADALGPLGELARSGRLAVGGRRLLAEPTSAMYTAKCSGSIILLSSQKSKRLKRSRNSVATECGSVPRCGFDVHTDGKGMRGAKIPKVRVQALASSEGIPLPKV